MQPSHDFGATLQFGTVAQVDDAGHQLRVQLPALDNLLTDWLPMITPAAGGNQFYSLPDEGELVVCLLDARGEGGCVIGAIYNAADTPPAASRSCQPAPAMAGGWPLPRKKNPRNTRANTAM